jgi:hypothetical protein
VWSYILPRPIQALPCRFPSLDFVSLMIAPGAPSSASGLLSPKGVRCS